MASNLEVLVPLLRGWSFTNVGQWSLHIAGGDAMMFHFSKIPDCHRLYPVFLRYAQLELVYLTK